MRWLHRLPRCVHLLVAAVLASVCLGATAADLVIREAQIAASEARFFPADAPERVTLPDIWEAPRFRSVHAVWYRASFDAAPASPNEPLALYVRRACSQADVRLNDSLIWQGGPEREPLRRLCYRPMLVVLPAALLRESGNTIDLHVRGLPLAAVAGAQRAAGLSELRIGPMSEMRALHDEQLLLSIDAPVLANVALGVVGAIVLGLWWFARRDIHLMYFGGAALLWALASARLWAVDLPLDTETVELLTACFFPLAAAMAVQFFLGYADLRSRAIEGTLVAQCLVMPASLFFAGPSRLFGIATGWYLLLIVELIAAVALYLRVAWRAKRHDFWPMCAVLGVGVVALLVEQAQQWRWVSGPALSMSHAVLPAALIGLGVRLIYAYARALQGAEAARAALEARIPLITAEVERNFGQLAELRVEQVTEKERKRIAADLHDDLGAKLLTIVHTSDNDRISSLAREALEEMRLSVRGLTGKPMNLADALADWRAEVVGRLGQANIEIDWRGPAEDTDLQLPARSYVQTTRILREAVSNIIKHSGASHCKVRCAVGDTQFGINIQDNGKGIPMELDGKLDRGHGMFSMKQRAKNMQGQCLVESGPGYGTVIRLTLPL